MFSEFDCRTFSDYETKLNATNNSVPFDPESALQDTIQPFTDDPTVCSEQVFILHPRSSASK